MTKPAIKPQIRKNFEAQAREAARTFDEIAKVFPRDEAAWIILRNAATRLRKCYVTRGKKRARILRFIGDGCLSVSELVAGTWWPRHEVEGLLRELLVDGFITDQTIPPAGGIGRPRRVFRVRE